MTRQELQDNDRAEVAAFIAQHWHSPTVMSRGRAFRPHEQQGFVERRDGKIVGLLTYHDGDDGMEILTLNSTVGGQRIGTSMMLEAIELARRNKCDRILLTMTNANLRAMGFYQRLGFRMVAINPGVVDEARSQKPEIPETGEGGIPIHDEIVMELKIEPYLDN